MRRVTGLVASALGTFLIVLALFMRFYVAGQAIKFPLNEDTISTLTASNVTYFSPVTLTELTGVTLQNTITVQGDVASGDSGRAVWDEFSYTYDITNHQQFEYTMQRLAFDRRSAELINCCGTFVGLKTNLQVSGLGYVWPFNAQERTYDVFDSILMKPMPFSYAGMAVIDGERAYKYVESVPATRASTETLPGSLVGVKDQQTVTLGEYYQGTTTEWVDPITGLSVKTNSNQHLYLAVSSGTPLLNLLQADFSSTGSTVASAVDTAKSEDNKINLLTLLLPLTLGLTGLIALVIGIILARPREQHADYDADSADEHEVGVGLP